MAAIPLYCKICPREPQFSDVSHLLTHVASKGHLSHYFKAQVRARQDQNVRNKINNYDQWYERNGIEKLLSQRMISKESKDSTSRPRVSTTSKESVNSAKSIKPRTRRIKTSTEEDQTPRPVKTEDAIDPQLSQYLLPATDSKPFLGISAPDAAAQHRSFIPRMIDDQTEDEESRDRFSSEASRIRQIARPTRSPDPGRDSEGDCFRAFLRSPTRTAYPDPSELPGLVSHPPPIEEDHESEKGVACQSPVLKGVKWPGMSLFDSASQEAQRLRNQKKDGSILEQMELDSAAIEPMEHIYWPEGTLKKKRPITGNVESSPIRVPTPPPKRRRTKVQRVLAEMSTNNPKIPRKRGRKPKQRTESVTSELRGVSQKALNSMKNIYSENARLSHDPAQDSEVERQLARGSLNVGRKPAFPVFHDDDAESDHPSKSHAIDLTKSPLLHRQPRHDNRFPPYRSVSTQQRNGTASRNHSLAPRGDSQKQKKHKELQPRTRPQPPRQSFATNDIEDPGGVLHRREELGEKNVAGFEDRVTQRYFSVAGNEAARFFSTLPPQMDFGGLGGPNFNGSALNPLTTYLHRHPFRPESPGIYFPQLGFPSGASQSQVEQNAVLHSKPTIGDSKHQRGRKVKS